MSEDEKHDEIGHGESSSSVSSFINCYKYSNRTISFTQERRRELHLQKQKEKRCEAFNEKRNLSDLFVEDVESMEYECAKVPKRSKKFPFGFKLMIAEWLMDVPADFADNWLVKLCPEGIRYLVVANRGLTTCYFINGKPCFKFKSNLPGGSADNYSNRFTVVDCVFNKNTNTFFIYDVLAWNSTSLINAEAQMRFFWLKSKFEENPDMHLIKHPKKFQFVLVDFFPAQTALVQDQVFTPFMMKEKELSIEGLLFYHKEGHYVSGHCPLVGWLRTFMLPEILHIDVPLIYMENKPENYESLQQYLNDKKKPKRRKENMLKMDTEEIESGVEDIECDNS